MQSRKYMFITEVCVLFVQYEFSFSEYFEYSAYILHTGTLDLTTIGLKLFFHIFHFFFVLNFPGGARMAWNYDC